MHLEHFFCPGYAISKQAVLAQKQLTAFIILFRLQRSNSYKGPA
jgi:hypothetical protein